MKVDLDNIEIMNLKPGDTVVYKLDMTLPLKTMQSILYNLEMMFPKNKVIVLDKNSNIEIYRPDIENDQD